MPKVKLLSSELEKKDAVTKQWKTPRTSTSSVETTLVKQRYRQHSRPLPTKRNKEQAVNEDAAKKRQTSSFIQISSINS